MWSWFFFYQNKILKNNWNVFFKLNNWNVFLTERANLIRPAVGVRWAPQKNRLRTPRDDWPSTGSCFELSSPGRMMRSPFTSSDSLLDDSTCGVSEPCPTYLPAHPKPETRHQTRGLKGARETEREREKKIAFSTAPLTIWSRSNVCNLTPFGRAYLFMWACPGERPWRTKECGPFSSEAQIWLEDDKVGPSTSGHVLG